MSKKEMESLDEQVLQVANSAGVARCADESEQDKALEEMVNRGKDTSNADAIAKAYMADRDCGTCPDDPDEYLRQEVAVAPDAHMAAKQKGALLKMLAKVAACLVAAAVFLALLLAPEMWAPVVGCCGIMTFVVVGAICVDRYAQIAKRWR